MDMDFREVMGVLKSKDGLKDMMLRPAFKSDDTGTEFSQAELVADVINILRMDTKRIAQAHGVEVEISQMTPERAAELLQEIAKGEGIALVEIFDEIENQRMRVLDEIEGAEARREYCDMKLSLLNVPDEDEEYDLDLDENPTENTDGDN